MSDYQKAIQIIEQATKFGINPSLEGIRDLCQKLADPQNLYTSVQIAGTNGKSSTARFLAAIISAHGYKVGLYTSPELCHIEERIEIFERIVLPEDFAAAVLTVNAALDKQQSLTEFELITAAALWLFAKNQVEYAVLEVGLGGRWDATSVVNPEIAVLTGVDFDHTAILGSTIEEIAGEKAAIIKTGATAVLAPTNPEALAVFEKRARDVGAKLVKVDKNQEPESYQSQNQQTAMTAAKVLLKDEFNPELACQAVLNTQVPGRFEILQNNPLVLIDAAHNPQSANHLAGALQNSDLLQDSPTLLLAILKDKDAQGIIQALSPLFNKIAVTRTTSERALEPEELAGLVLDITGTQPQVFNSTKDAVVDFAAKNQPYIASGSITLAGEVKRLLTQNQCSDKISK